MNNQPQRCSLQAYTRGQYFQKQNNPLCCAERRLISDLYRHAQEKKIQNHKIAHWIHRKFKHITIERETSYGPGISFPCLYCRSSLERLDMRVTCFVDNKVQCVRISDTEYISKLTTGQMLKNEPVKPCVVQSCRTTRRANRELIYNKPGKK